MKEVNVITLENGKEYIIVGTVNVDGNGYIFTSNEDDPDDIQIRKIINKNGKDYITKLESTYELDKVLVEYYNKYGKGGKNE